MTRCNLLSSKTLAHACNVSRYIGSRGRFKTVECGGWTSDNASPVRHGRAPCWQWMGNRTDTRCQDKPLSRCNPIDGRCMLIQTSRRMVVCAMGTPMGTVRNQQARKWTDTGNPAVGVVGRYEPSQRQACD